MQALSNKHKSAATYVLITLGVLAIGFLIYVVVDRLSSPEASVVVQAVPAEETVAIEIPSNSDSPAEMEESAEIPIGIRIGQRAPDFLLRSLDNENVALSDYRGHVVILDFWASWCGPCKSTMPGLESLAQALAPDVVLIGVSLDQTAAKASNYLEANDFSAMIALYESYTAALAVSKTYAVVGIPKTYVIDRTGIIRYVGHPASLSRQTGEGLI
jgi:thiol-disulfide isomerase/thioredoxin